MLGVSPALEHLHQLRHAQTSGGSQAENGYEF